MGLEKFTLPDAPKDGAAIDLIYLDGPSLHRSGDFNLGLIGNGFEANRYLTRDEMEQLRDWINASLARSS